MEIRVGNIVLNRCSPSQRLFLNNYFNSLHLHACSLASLDRNLREIKSFLNDRFRHGAFTVSFPFYVYPKGILSKKDEICVVDFVVNDIFLWEEERKKNGIRYCVPPSLHRGLKKYQELLKKHPGKISWNEGYYSTTGAKTSSLERSFLEEIDVHFPALTRVVTQGSDAQEMTDAVFLMGYAMKNEEKAIHMLKKLLTSPDHALHNMAARALFPKAVLRRCKFIIPCFTLTSHHNPFCQNKYLGTASRIQWTKEEKEFLRDEREHLQKLAKNKQRIVSFFAKKVLKKIR